MSVMPSRRLLVDHFLAHHPLDAARVLEAASTEEILALLVPAPAGATADVLALLNPDRGARVLAQLPEPVARPLLEALDPVREAILISRLPSDDRQRLLELTTPERRREIDEIRLFPPGTAGHLMDAQVTVFPGETTVETAWARIGELRGRRITDVVLVDDERKFSGVVRLQEIAAAEPEHRLDSLQDPRAVHVHPMASREEVVDVLNQHRLASLTVVDSGWPGDGCHPP